MPKLTIHNSPTIQKAFDSFLMSKSCEGVTNKTLSTYEGHLRCISKHLNIFLLLSELEERDLQLMIISMRRSGLAPNSIASYIRTFKSFLTWARSRDLTTVSLPQYKAEETVKTTYTDEELEILLKKPNLSSCSFAEYRDCVIINFLMNSGARSSTIREILIKDVDLKTGLLTYRHNKNHKVQAIPLCSRMISILAEYLHYREGSANDFLFCAENGDKLSEQGLKTSIKRYNLRRGVTKTSIHLFRHTFARKYLVDCDGDAFTLQTILGHSTLDMTKHYCNIYNVELAKTFDLHSPLQQMIPKGKKIRLRKK